MSRLYIPEIGDTITLDKDWKFNLYYEDRNKKLFDVLIDGGYDTFINNDISISATMISTKRKETKSFILNCHRNQFETLSREAILCDYLLHYQLDSLFNSSGNIKISINNDWKSSLTQIIPTEFVYGKTLENRVGKYNFRVINPHSGYLITALPKGTTLKIDRVYIRKGNDDFSSLTFFIENCPIRLKSKRKIRFWAKLQDCNTMEIV